MNSVTDSASGNREAATARYQHFLL